ncbi:hypothetical protein BJ165DRAFT_850005 [Panaeolus papilionaceus]|nr:hypothetical protein BJ165DRAFT_850005 [Panaeolus papilionaceus]
MTRQGINCYFLRFNPLNLQLVHCSPHFAFPPNSIQHTPSHASIHLSIPICQLSHVFLSICLIFVPLPYHNHRQPLTPDNHQSFTLTLRHRLCFPTQMLTSSTHCCLVLLQRFSFPPLLPIFHSPHPHRSSLNTDRHRRLSSSIPSFRCF